jgi:hypothetical protein
MYVRVSQYRVLKRIFGRKNKQEKTVIIVGV